MMDDVDEWNLDTYRRVCAETPVGKHGATNHPAQFDTLGPAEHAALRYWCRTVFTDSSRLHERDSYGFKHDFEEEGFYVTNGQFKGAMLIEGFLPADPLSLNWRFRVRGVAKFGVCRRHTLGRFDREFMRLLLATRTGRYMAEQAGFRLVSGG